jgi:gentisate 1,2-dioxygenase
MVWLDGLDVPLVSALDAGFSEKRDFGTEQTPKAGAEHGDDAARGVKRQACDTADARANATLRPVRRSAPYARAGAHFVYPHSQWRETLHRISRSEPLDAHDGFRMEFVNPADGSAAMPTISAFCQLVPKGVATRALRATDGTVYVVTEGEGRAVVGDEAFDLVADDIFVVPSWSSRTFTAISDLALFSFSDRATQQSLALWREQL